MNLVYPHGETLLNDASYVGNLFAVEALIRQGADPNLGDTSPLMDALNGAWTVAEFRSHLMPEHTKAPDIPRSSFYEIIATLLRAGANRHFFTMTKSWFTVNSRPFEPPSFVEHLIMQVCKPIRAPRPTSAAPPATSPSIRSPSRRPSKLEGAQESREREQATCATAPAPEGEVDVTVCTDPDQDPSDLNTDLDKRQQVAKDESPKVKVYVSAESLVEEATRRCRLARQLIRKLSGSTCSGHPPGMCVGYQEATKNPLQRGKQWAKSGCFLRIFRPCEWCPVAAPPLDLARSVGEGRFTGLALFSANF